jgi:ABC-2 type transport system ATP-binding protein
MPLREFEPVVQQDRTIELPGIAVEVPEGQSAYLTVSPVSDMFFGHGSTRTPGVVGLEDITVNLPVVP